MKLFKRFFSAALVVGAVALMAYFTDPAAPRAEALEADSQPGRETLHIWYTDDDLAEYIGSAALSFTEKAENSHVRIVATQVPALEYLERINSAAAAGTGPDLFVMAHDQLEKAYLARLASEVAAEAFASVRADYPQAGVNAVTYQEKILAYPLYFETSALLYNKSHLTEMIKIKIEADADEAAAIQAELDLAEFGPTDEIDETSTHLEEVLRLLADEDYVAGQVEDLLPETFENLTEIANLYGAPDGVTGILKWDVNDIFYNYFFVGNAITVGGETGDDSGNIDISNGAARKALEMYQNLNQFFAIETSEVRYSAVIEEFIAGELVYTIATTDAVARLRAASEAGEFPYEYGVLRTPDIDSETPTRPLSMVSCVAINGYSPHQAEANRFAAYLAGEFAGNLYARAGKVPVALSATEGSEELAVFAAEFARSIPLPKMMVTSNFWIQLENAFARIWEGGDVGEQLRQLAALIEGQVS
ncbi:MAG: extracellular solute-binding protein [Lachnospiraceae bacterium]|jgi:maltose-binding protein MalE|nr:extracellular solute-binding protein [Lachnospiraceae bacterium]